MLLRRGVHTAVAFWTRASLVGSTAWCAVRSIGTDGRVTNEDRRWWLLHLECAPDITPGTFVAWLDGCNTNTTKKLIERDIWTIEQVASLNADVVDELKYKEGCIKMDIVWEHARTILQPLRNRQKEGGVESELQARVLQLRKKRELERERLQLLKERAETNQEKEKLLKEQREAIAKKKEQLRQQIEAKRKRIASHGSKEPDTTATAQPTSTPSND